MLILQQLRTYFWNIDPGNLYLKLATRTILAVLLAIIILRRESLLTQVVGGIASTTSMQGIIARRWIYQALHMLIFDVAYFGCFILGFMVRGTHLWKAIVLIILGFVVNYIRRIGFENSLAPAMLWLLCFFATVLPLPDPDLDWWNYATALWVGFGTSAFVLLILFPNKDSKLLKNNIERFFQTLGDGLQDIRRKLLNPNTEFLEKKIILSQILAVEQAICQNSMFSPREQRLAEIVNYQYALLNAYSIILSAIEIVGFNQLPRSTLISLSHLCKQFTKLFKSFQISNNFLINTPNIVFLPNLEDLQQKIILPLLHFKLAFTLFNQYTARLLHNPHET